jgi:hypothetical protein
MKVKVNFFDRGVGGTLGLAMGGSLLTLSVGKI